MFPVSPSLHAFALAMTGVESRRPIPFIRGKGERVFQETSHLSQPSSFHGEKEEAINLHISENMTPVCEHFKTANRNRDEQRMVPISSGACPPPCCRLFASRKQRGQNAYIIAMSFSTSDRTSTAAATNMPGGGNESEKDISLVALTRAERAPKPFCVMSMNDLSLRQDTTKGTSDDKNINAVGGNEAWGGNT